MKCKAGRLLRWLHNAFCYQCFSLTKYVWPVYKLLISKLECNYGDRNVYTSNISFKYGYFFLQVLAFAERDIFQVSINASFLSTSQWISNWCKENWSKNRKEKKRTPSAWFLLQDFIRKLLSVFVSPFELCDWSMEVFSLSFITMIVKYQLGTFRYFCLEFFLAVD